GELLRDAQEPDRLRTGEDAELGPSRDLGRVLELEPEAEVRLVAPEPPVRLRVREPREWRLELEADALAPHRLDHPLDRGEEELLVGERHLDVELRDLLHAVGAQVLVAEADRDLVVALEACDHEQLLRDLRRLRQRVEPPRLEARRDEEVARSLR